MRLLHTRTLTLKEFPNSQRAEPYAILSHVWREEEVLFHHIQDLNIAKKLRGFPKVFGCCERARDEGYEWVWIDTCCIDKSSSSELSEAINSMFAWYKEAEVCYVYLDDVPAKPAALYISATLITDDIETVRKWEDDSDDESSDDSSIYKDMGPDAPDEFVEDGSESERWLAMFKDSRWFTRGWTLQELIAPRESVFLAQNWSEVGTRKDMVHVIEEASRVHRNVLLGVLLLEEVSIADRMRWASRRSTTRVEDRAYSLMGLFGIHMPTIYGEGIEAFMRLQHEILQRTTDHTIFAWTFSDRPNWDSCLAHGPECFSHIRLMEQIPYTEYSKIFGISDFLPPEHSLTNFGIRIHLPIRPHKSEKDQYLAALACYDCRTPRYKRIYCWSLRHVAGTKSQYRFIDHAVVDCDDTEGFEAQDIYVVHIASSSAHGDDRNTTKFYILLDREQLATQNLHPLTTIPRRSMWDTDAGSRLKLRIERYDDAKRRCGAIMLRETPSMRRIVVVVGVDPSPSHDPQSSYWTSGFAMDLVVENDTDDWSAKGYDGNATFTRSELVHWSGKQFFQRSQIFGEGFIHMIVDTDSRTESRLAGDRGTFTARLFVEHSPYLMGRMLVDFLTSLLRELLRKQKQWYSRIKEKTRWRPESGDREAFAAIALLPPWRSYRIWELDWDTHDKEILATAALDTAGSQPLWRVYVDRVRFHDNDQLLGQKDFGRFCREAKDLDIAPIITYWMEARRLAQIHESRLYQT